MKKISKYCISQIKYIIQKIHFLKKIHQLLKYNKTKSIDEGYKKDIRMFWNKYGVNINYNWHRWYSINNSLNDIMYISEDVFYLQILPFYNKLELRKAYEDKALLNVLFPNVKQPITIFKNINGIYYNDLFSIISLEESVARCRGKKVIIKPSIDSGGGKNIHFVNMENEVDDLKLKVILEGFKKDYVVQEVLEQHADLGLYNPESVNTVRVMSFLYDNKISIISSVFRMGTNGSKVDNSSLGGIACGIFPDGTLKEYAYDKMGNKLMSHPQGITFKNRMIPKYNQIIDIVKREHQKLGHFKIISWDFAVDNTDTPVLIECNLGYQEINFHQLNNGPLFGELTSKILEDVFLKNSINC